ncbi:MAG: PASTA domain-containing protein [Candidatus Saganbacteria bacterium]|nr:PASTA domain-containing protein [Candidatus Saganbacteria bacterium]
MADLVIYFMLSAVALAVIGYFIGAGKISLKPVTLLVMFLILVLPVGLNLFIWIYSGTIPEVFVPDVLGSPGSDAVAVLEKTGLKGEIAGISFSKEPGGTVISQQPEGGKKVKAGRLVKLIISARERSVTVPNLIGKTSTEAESILISFGLNIGQVFESPGDGTLGIVTDQKPAVGEVVSLGSNVSVTITVGNETRD